MKLRCGQGQGQGGLAGQKQVSLQAVGCREPGKGSEQGWEPWCPHRTAEGRGRGRSSLRKGHSHSSILFSRSRQGTVSCRAPPPSGLLGNYRGVGAGCLQAAGKAGGEVALEAQKSPGNTLEPSPSSGEELGGR